MLSYALISLLSLGLVKISSKERDAVYKTIFSRRDVRREFLSTPISEDVLKRVLTAAHHAPSVGFMQPWDFIVVKNSETKAKIKAGFEQAHAESSAMFDADKAETYQNLKLEGVMPIRKLFTLALCAICGFPWLSYADQQGILEKDLDVLLKWFPGRYDNSLQVFWQPELCIPEEEHNYQRHSIFREVELPVFGERVLYAEQSRDGDLDNIYRQRLYVFTTDLEEKAIRLRVHVPKETESLKGAYRDPGLLAHLKPEDTITWDGCDLFWKREPNQFIGRLKEGECRFTSKRFGQEILLDEYLILSPEALWFADKGTSLDGKYLFGMKGDIPSKSLKARPFECWASILRGAKHGDSGEDMNDWDFRRGLWFHDQGGEIRIQTDETPPRDIRLLLRRMEWPDKNNRPSRLCQNVMSESEMRQKQAKNRSLQSVNEDFEPVFNDISLSVIVLTQPASLVLYIFEGNRKRATSYTWTEFDSERIGINLRWLQASCTHAPERVYSDGR